MKIVKVGLCGNDHHATGDKVVKYVYQLIIENLDDVEVYAKHFSELAARANADAYVGFKKQKFRSTLSDYLVHEGPRYNSVTKLVAMKLNYKDTPTSILEYASMCDSIMESKIANIYKFVAQGKLVRTSHSGGYCYDTEEYYNLCEEILDDVSEEQTINFLRTGNPSYELGFTNESVLIENQSEVDADFMFKVRDHKEFNLVDYQIITDFKVKTQGFSKEKLVNLFMGSKKIQHSIFFSTTGQDSYQLSKMYELIKNIKEKTLKVFIHSDNEEVFDIFKSTDTLKVNRIC